MLTRGGNRSNLQNRNLWKRIKIPRLSISLSQNQPLKPIFQKKNRVEQLCAEESEKSKNNFLPAYQPGLPNNELIYKCPVRGCGKAFSKLGGIFKHLVPAHGYQVIFSRIVKKNCQ